MAKKPNVRGQIRDGAKALQEIMEDELSKLAQAMVDQVMSRARNLPPSRKLEAIKDISTPGLQAYRGMLQTALATVAADAIEGARKEVPKAKDAKLSDCEEEGGVQLAEFDGLPKKLQKKIKALQDLITTKQVGDLTATVSFQFTHSHDSTDSDDIIQKDMEGAAEDWLAGTSVAAGAQVASAQMVNGGRMAFFTSDEVAPELDAMQFQNGDPVTPICQDLNGQVFAPDDPEAFRYIPPLHFNCKSYITPILQGKLNGREVGDLKPSTSELEKEIQFSESEGRCCGSEHF